MSLLTDYKVEIEVFEGPLDLLLHLVKKHELNVLEIPVAFVTEKYLEYLELMRQLNLEIAGEYLLMAATLAHLKSRELLPSSADPLGEDGDTSDEDTDPREELIRRLLEYQKYKGAAASLGDRPVVGRNVFTRGAPVGDALFLPEAAESAEAPLMAVPVIQLLEALSQVLAKARVKLTHEVIVERLSITDRINELVDRLEVEGSFSFQSCFSFLDSEEEMGEAQLKHHVVITFLAILEMAKLKLIRISQPEDKADIYLSRAVPDVKARASSGNLSGVERGGD
ncbi:MAG: segregation/condensation protein A [Deltaproteobacteria bacterium]|nr:segregation/condensation protein A [Deltaproteobacteria bacterium]